jgi:predicted MFS family arabinose efflux permease
MAPRRYQNAVTFLFNAVTNGALGVGAWLAGIVAADVGFPLLLALSGIGIGAALWLRYRF